MSAQTNGRQRLLRAYCLQWTLVVAVVALLSGLAACGQSVSDSKPGADSRAAVLRGENAGTQEASQALDRGVNLGGERSSVKGRPSAEQPAIVMGKTEETNSSPSRSHSGTASNERTGGNSGMEALDSPPPGALAPEAAEGEIPAMQATPAMVLEQYWAMQQQADK